MIAWNIPAAFQNTLLKLEKSEQAHIPPAPNNVDSPSKYEQGSDWQTPAHVRLVT